MDFQQYVPDDFGYGLSIGLLCAAIIGSVLAFLVGILGLLFWRKHILYGIGWAFIAGAMFGVAAGFVFSIDIGRTENTKILQQNISKKYDAKIIKMATDPNSGRSASPYPASNKTTHEVTIKVNGETKLAYLKQDQDTNEPTLLNYDTKQPLTNLEKK